MSRWPTPGYELESAYQTIVKDQVLPKFQEMNLSIANGPIGYLSNEENKEKIMENFARVTVYIKSLSVERVVHVPAYSLVDLLSDTGKVSVFSN